MTRSKSTSIVATLAVALTMALNPANATSASAESPPKNVSTDSASDSTKQPSTDATAAQLRAVEKEIRDLKEARDGLIDLVPAMTNRIQQGKLIDGLLPIARLILEKERELLCAVAQPNRVDEHVAASGAAIYVKQSGDEHISILTTDARATTLKPVDGGYNVTCVFSVQNGGNADWDAPIRIAVKLPENASLTEWKDDWTEAGNGMLSNKDTIALAKYSVTSRRLSFFVPESSETPLFTVIAQEDTNGDRGATRAGKTIPVYLTPESDRN